MRGIRRFSVRKRSGATAVESAVVLPVVFLLTTGLIVGGIGVFRYLQVACLAREGARWASVRGGGYQRDTNTSSPTRQQVIDQAVLPYASGVDATSLDVKVEWIDQATGTAFEWDVAAKDVTSITVAGEAVTNAVRVTVSHRWTFNVLGSVTAFESVCEMPMSN